MLFQSLTAAAALFFGASTALPSPQLQARAIDPNAKFHLTATVDGKATDVQAALSSLFVNLPAQNATCDVGHDATATFFLKDDGLFLFAKSATPQQLYADRSGMGQGKFGYTTGAQPTPKNGERTPFTLGYDNQLQLKGSDKFIACPNSVQGAWSIWASSGVANPAGNSGCKETTLKASVVANPNGCIYSS
ncbi:cell wall protein PhiA [Hypoxylon fragiforme]|uniref:cell wall protein PhiA n=1 Tax=Hypoxylon fragiforme TaxID=63214 RepID=UPI0020C6C8FF|nr:cell wall protein PhiA [Hypoxylon fragiforme]KAI2605329.1 cell wall protein PhiA [Hypoxylon fragiforme]